MGALSKRSSRLMPLERAPTRTQRCSLGKRFLQLHINFTIVWTVLRRYTYRPYGAYMRNRWRFYRHTAPTGLRIRVSFRFIFIEFRTFTERVEKTHAFVRIGRPRRNTQAKTPLRPCVPRRGRVSRSAGKLSKL